LRLNENKLSGSIPEMLGKLKNLTRLYLYQNSLTGSIPKELGNLSNLTHLDLNNNSLSGNIPEEIRNLKSLVLLDLSNNKLTGSTPIWASEQALLNMGTALYNDNLFDEAATIVPDAETTEPETAKVSPETTIEWPSPYNGVTPDASYGLEFNNIGVLNSADATIYVCLRIFTDGLSSSVNGVSQFDMGLKVASLSDATVQITKSREFNAIGALNEEGQTPDCSGVFETTTGAYTDIIQTDTSVLETTWNLIDPTNLILKLDSAHELKAN
jgi:hypothetical protein